jgi:hypothetical protein
MTPCSVLATILAIPYALLLAALIAHIANDIRHR